MTDHHDTEDRDTDRIPVARDFDELLRLRKPVEQEDG